MTAEIKPEIKPLDTTGIILLYPKRFWWRECNESIQKTQVNEAQKVKVSKIPQVQGYPIDLATVEELKT